MTRAMMAAAVVGAASVAAHAQFQGLVVTTLTDPVSGLPLNAALPGQTVRVRTTVSWAPGAGTQMAGIRGDMLSTPVGFGGVGVVSNRFSEYQAGSLVNLGSVSGDDIVGIDIAVTPGFFTGGWLVPPSYSWQGIEFTGYDWTAPNEIGVYEFKFFAPAVAPNLRIYPTLTSPAFIEVPTTYSGATLVVVPGPGAGCVVVVGGLLSRRRR